MPREILVSISLNYAIFLQVNGGPLGTVTELMFEKKGLIPDLQHMLTIITGEWIPPSFEPQFQSGLYSRPRKT